VSARPAPKVLYEARAYKFGTTSPEHRNRIKLVHIAKKDLALSDDDYRDILRDLTGFDSSKNCTTTQLGSVLDHFRQRGWVHKPKSGKPRFAKQADHPAARKARALWLSLWNLGEAPSKDERALEGFATKQLGCERLQWADQTQCYKLVEALKARCVRAGFDPVSPSIREIKLRLLDAVLVKLQSAGLADPDWDVGFTVSLWFGDDTVRPLDSFSNSELDELSTAFGTRLREGIKK
jgi:phage gp16-like protein